MSTAKRWRFRPFLLDGAPSTVCAMAAISDPGGDDDVALAALPASVPDAFSGTIGIGAKALHRVAGTTMVSPDDREKEAILDDPDGRAVNRFQVCIDETGAVAAVTMMTSSGFPRLDARTATAIAGWKYEPVEIDGRPAAVGTECCSPST